MKKFLLILTCSILTFGSFAQSKSHEYKQKLSLKAGKFYKDYNYVKALEVYKELDELGSISAPRRIGDCYRQMNDMINAELYYARAVKQKNVKPNYIFYYAQTLMSNSKYKAAIDWFKAYTQVNPDNDRADKMIQACENALKKQVENSVFKISNLDINSTAQDFAPSFYDKGILFTSSRIESVIRKKDSWTNTGYLDVYYSPLNWQDTIPWISRVKGNVNTFNFHDGPACANKEGTKIYFTRNNVVAGSATKSRSGDIKLKIFSAEKYGDGFRNLHELEFNGNEYSSAHPSVNHNDKVVFFSSDRAGGYGGTDIYYSSYNETKKRWNRAVNVGSEVNTEGDEKFPFIHDSGALFFASNEHMGLGGLDIFKAIPHDSIPNKFIAIENLGEPFNSSRDDFSYIVDSNKITGYFASNRDGGKGNDDIYLFTSAIIPLHIEIATNKNLNSNTSIIIYDLDRNIILDRNHTDENGNFYSRLQPNSNYMIELKSTENETIKHPVKTSDNEKPIQLKFDF